MSTATAPRTPPVPAAGSDASGNPEWHALLECARRAAGLGGPFDPAAWGRGASWERLAAMARYHGMYPLLADFVAREQPARVTEAQRAPLADWYLANVGRNLNLMRQLLALLQALEARGVQAIAYKGPLLAAHVLGHVGRRACADLDVLVPRAQLAVAEGVLREAGYAPMYPMSPGQRRMLLRTAHETTFAAPGRVPVELHWRLAQRAFVPRLEHERLWEGARQVPFGAHMFRTFGPEDQAIALCVHGAKQGWAILEWVVTLAALSRTGEVDWERALARASEWRLRRPVLLGVGLTAEVMGAPLPSRVQAALGTDAGLRRLVRERAARLPLDRFPTLRDVLRMQLRAADGTRERLRFLRDTALDVSQEDVLTADLPRPLLPAYHLIRPARLLASVLRPERAPPGRV